MDNLVSWPIQIGDGHKHSRRMVMNMRQTFQIILLIISGILVCSMAGQSEGQQRQPTEVTCQQEPKEAAPVHQKRDDHVQAQPDAAKKAGEPQEWLLEI